MVIVVVVATVVMIMIRIVIMTRNDDSNPNNDYTISNSNSDNGKITMTMNILNFQLSLFHQHYCHIVIAIIDNTIVIITHVTIVIDNANFIHDDINYSCKIDIFYIRKTNDNDITLNAKLFKKWREIKIYTLNFPSRHIHFHFFYFCFVVTRYNLLFLPQFPLVYLESIILSPSIFLQVIPPYTSISHFLLNPPS